MERKTIKLRDETYRRLRAARRRGETFADTVEWLLDTVDDRQRKLRGR